MVPGHPILSGYLNPGQDIHHSLTTHARVKYSLTVSLERHGSVMEERLWRHPVCAALHYNHWSFAILQHLPETSITATPQKPKAGQGNVTINQCLTCAMTEVFCNLFVSHIVSEQLIGMPLEIFEDSLGGICCKVILLQAWILPWQLCNPLVEPAVFISSPVICCMWRWLLKSIILCGIRCMCHW